ncbi:glutathione S-transferase family protein [Kordiimonas aquimaris]|uniref:glutathione S-transferase family protein n=1 Tax=Kordiimonas aquimaris TaxID=707591 RepID=UPI0021D26636|nr:glutathione S-transferase family protein [Kordiimonas aquimaris]
MKIYGDKISGNCLKVKYVCDLLNISYNWIDVDVVAGEAKRPEMVAKNAVGQVPFIELDDGRTLSQSNAIMRFLSEGSHLIPNDGYQRALMDQWLFWEQYSHETAIAVARFQVRFAGKAVTELNEALVEKGNSALAVMEMHLSEADWFVGDRLSLADIALFAYTQYAEEGGFSLSSKPFITAWLKRVREVVQ